MAKGTIKRDRNEIAGKREVNILIDENGEIIVVDAETREERPIKITETQLKTINALSEVFSQQGTVYEKYLKIKDIPELASLDTLRDILDEMDEKDPGYDEIYNHILALEGDEYVEEDQKVA